jgi:hypothetical protein
VQEALDGKVDFAGDGLKSVGEHGILQG